MNGHLYSFVLKRLHTSRLTYDEIAAGSGVRKKTISRIKRQETKNPSVHTIELLADFFKSKKTA